MRAVLIVVDMLNDFFDRSPVLAMQRARLAASTNLLARGFRGRGLPVFWVRQEFAPDLHDAFPEMRAKKLLITIAYENHRCRQTSDQTWFEVWKGVAPANIHPHS